MHFLLDEFILGCFGGGLGSTKKVTEIRLLAPFPLEDHVDSWPTIYKMS